MTARPRSLRRAREHATIGCSVSRHEWFEMIANGDLRQSIQEDGEMSIVTRHLERRQRGRVGSPMKTILIALAAVVTLTETQPSDPYSVKLWIVGKGPLLYVHAGANRAAWVEHIEANANVRVLIDGNLYELVAERVTDQGEFDAFGDLYEAKYGNRPRNEDVDEAYLFRLGARSG